MVFIIIISLPVCFFYYKVFFIVDKNDLPLLVLLLKQRRIEIKMLYSIDLVSQCSLLQYIYAARQNIVYKISLDCSFLPKQSPDFKITYLYVYY